MKIASFNVNGIRARKLHLRKWLNESHPDVVLLQEIKCLDMGFPYQDFEDLGYNIAIHGQKSFNGVAIFSKFPLEDVTRGLPGDNNDMQARWIEATVSSDPPIRVCCLYLPNGNPAPGPKYDYKLAWMERLIRHATDILALEEASLLAGDFNVIPQSEDARHPEDWDEDALFRPETRRLWHQLVNLGFYDAFRLRCTDSEQYTFWDFQAGAWQRNDGIRIDHFLLTPQCADLLADCAIDRDVRGWEKPSDHVPIWVEINPASRV
ncbi:MAG: exodeoxyribonuclease III [Rhodobacteraceae bacterium]|nr:exodeoxyribonuclease III [Paracoccaceae bacterium]